MFRFVSLILATVTLVSADLVDVRVGWNRVEDPFVLNYHLYYWNDDSPSSFTNKLLIHQPETEATVLGLTAGTKTHFCVTSVDDQGRESLPSEIITRTNAVHMPEVPIVLTTVTGETNGIWTVKLVWRWFDRVDYQFDKYWLHSLNVTENQETEQAFKGQGTTVELPVGKYEFWVVVTNSVGVSPVLNSMKLNESGTTQWSPKL